MRKKRLLTLILALSLIICSGTVSYGEDFDIVRWDYDHLPGMINTENSVYAKDPDNSSVRFEGNTMYFDGKGTVGKDKRGDAIQDAGGEENIKYIVIGEGITHIAGGIFKNELPNLESITVEGGHAFDEFGQSSFAVNKALKTLEVKPGKKTGKNQGFEISHHAFRICDLEDVTLNNVWHLGKRSFQRNIHLRSVDLGYLHHMRGDAFEGCTALETIEVADDNPYFEVKEDGFLYKKYCPYYEDNGMYNMEVPALMCVPAAKSGETLIPAKKTRTIGYAACAGNSNIKAAKAVAGVKQIQARAFYDCDNLKELYISKSVTHIGNEAFSRYTKEDSDSPNDDYEEHPYATDSYGDDDENISVGNVTDIYYGGSEEEWKKIVYDKYDKDAKYCTSGGTVADNLKQVGLSQDVTIHYNWYDPDIIIPAAVKSGEKITVSCAAILAKSKKITFDLGFTPTAYNITPVDGAPLKGIKVNKKGVLTSKNIEGSYEIEVTGAQEKETVRLYVEKPVMKKKQIILDSDAEKNKYSISTMLSGLSFLEPEKYESKKPAVAEINTDTGDITAKAKGSSKITVTVLGKKFNANFKVKLDKKKK
ncbi:MAG: leucine-rich repeat protein [Lachnospiraceae bacterium]|nr:leucine-rich repeat protein [Lachnospiraceae bacterium]